MEWGAKPGTAERPSSARRAPIALICSTGCRMLMLRLEYPRRSYMASISCGRTGLNMSFPSNGPCNLALTAALAAVGTPILGAPLSLVTSTTKFYGSPRHPPQPQVLFSVADSIPSLKVPVQGSKRAPSLTILACRLTCLLTSASEPVLSLAYRTMPLLRGVPALPGVARKMRPVALDRRC
jgi:hypothetical protein